MSNNLIGINTKFREEKYIIDENLSKLLNLRLFLGVNYYYTNYIEL